MTLIVCATYSSGFGHLRCYYQLFLFLRHQMAHLDSHVACVH